MPRDEFTSATKTKLARRVGYLCSHPECRRPTSGPGAGGGDVNIGEAAHITAAAPGGRRYDASLSPAQRRSEANGIWLCAVHAKHVDSDELQFTVDRLRDWKTSAERAAFNALTTGRISLPALALDLGLDVQVLERLDLRDADLDQLAHRVRTAALADIAAFQSTSQWPSHAIALTLRVIGSDAPAFDVAACAIGIQASSELAIVAPPGTGKSTTAIQLVDAILANEARVAVLVPLTEWSALGGSILGSLTHRAAFRGFREQDFIFLALHGRLTLVLDAWNELDPSSRRSAIEEISRLRRESPLLELAVTTRRQALDVPISGPVIEIESLSANQQMEIARAIYGDRGEQRLDHAWRTPGLRELVSIPLYLNALLREATGNGIPTTKDEVLKIFIQQHEQLPANAEALRQGLHGLHADILIALATEATTSGNTALTETRSRTVVAAATAMLKAAGQISQEPQPADILDLLVNHHTLVRTGSHGVVSFQHQQIQEWYASTNVEELMQGALESDESRCQLRTDILNIPAWEEAILFACERLSCSGDSGANAVGACILDSLTIDPILGADMIFRSSPVVWEKIKDDVVVFINKWHTRGTVDRAVRFMITTGCGEFAPLIWPLIAHSDDQVHLAALRAARRFRSSVLGLDGAAKLAALPDDVRLHVITGIAHDGGIEGMDLAAELAKTDPSQKIQVAVIEALLFRHSHRLVKDVLRTAPNEVWSQLSRRRFADEITDAEILSRLQVERDRALDDEPDTLRRIGMLLERRDSKSETGIAIAALIQSSAFPTRERSDIWTLSEAFEQYPSEVSSALFQRLADGQDLPFGAADLLAHSDVIDEGPIADLALRGESKTAAEYAATFAGPKTIGALVDQLLELHVQVAATGRRFSSAESDEHFRLSNLIEQTRPVPFVRAWLDRCATEDPATIAVLSDLLARHGRPRNSETKFQLDDATSGQAEAVCFRWTDVLISSLVSHRHQLAELARAIGRLATPQLVEALNRLLVEDLARWRRGREAFEQARARRRQLADRGDLATSYTNQYRSAFTAIGGPRVSTIMGTYLLDPDFGFDAAIVLKDVHDMRSRPKPESRPFPMWPDFSGIAVRRSQRANFDSETSPAAEAILAATESLIAPSSNQSQHRQALQLARVGLSMPHGDKAPLVNALLNLPLPIRSKCDLLTVLVMNGTIISADMVMNGIGAWLDEARQKAWFRDQGRWELERWLSLLPFSDRPSALLEAFDRIGPLIERPVGHSPGLLLALQGAPGPEVERVLIDLACRKPELLAEHSWLDALLNRATTTSCWLLLDLLDDPEIGAYAGRLSAWHAADMLVAVMLSTPTFRDELISRYEAAKTAACNAVIEQTFAKSPDSKSLIAMVRRKAVNGKGFDSLLHMAVENIVLERRPLPDAQGFYEVRSVDVTDVRKQLFAVATAKTSGAALALRCLTVIDRLRDRHGRSDFETRHPDIETGRAWPFVPA